jgi:hypothetical protein
VRHAAATTTPGGTLRCFLDTDPWDISGCARACARAGTADKVIRVSNARGNYRALRAGEEAAVPVRMAPYYCEGAGHNDLDTLDSAEYGRQLKQFFKKMHGSSDHRTYAALAGKTDLAASLAARAL